MGAFTLLLLLQVLLRPYLPVDETRYLDVAWEMHLSGDPFHLTRNFEPYAHKPPLLFWLINAVWAVTGVSAFWGRLVGPAFAVLLVALTSRLAGRLWPQDPGAPRRAAWILAGFTLFALYGGATMFDAMLGVAVVIGVGALWRIGCGGATRDWVMFGFALGFGVCAKGPVILLHLLPPLLAIRLWATDPQPLPGLLRGSAVAMAVGLGLTALWVGPTLLGADAAFREELLWTQSAARVAGGMAHDRPVWFLVALLPVLLFPWGWSPGFWRGLSAQLGQDRASRLLIVWAGAALILFSVVSGKQVHYLLPELPAVALLIARAGDRAARTLAPWAGLGLGAALVGLAGASTMGIVSAAPFALHAASVAGTGLVVMLLAVACWVSPGVLSTAMLGGGMALALHLTVAASTLKDDYDSERVATVLRAENPSAIAVFGMLYSGEFNFAERMATPVTLPATQEDLLRWTAENPGGIVLAPVQKLRGDAPPSVTLEYAGRALGIWRNEALTRPGV